MKSHKILAQLLTMLSTAVALCSAPAHAALLGRDISGHAVASNDDSAVFLYDTTLNITWLRDANYNKDNDYNGRMSWHGANGWAADFVVGGIDNWRLPTMVDTPTPGCDFSYSGGTDCGYNVQTTSSSTVYSEMASLWYDTLGNKAKFAPGTGYDLQEVGGWGLTNRGDFLNMQSDVYWSGTPYALDGKTNDNWHPSYNPSIAWYFAAYDGAQFAYFQFNKYYAMAVRDGDVLQAPTNSIPEPSTIALLLVGLGLAGAVRRRKESQVRIQPHFRA